MKQSLLHLRLPYGRINSCKGFRPTTFQRNASFFSRRLKKGLLSGSSSNSDSWQDSQPELPAYEQTARKLNRSLSSPGNAGVDQAEHSKQGKSASLSKTNRNLVMSLVEQSPDKILSPEHIKLVELAFRAGSTDQGSPVSSSLSSSFSSSSSIPSGFTLSDIFDIFQSVIQNPLDQLVEFELISSLYSILHAHSDLSVEDSFEISLFYFRFLRKKGAVVGANKLMDWIFSKYTIDYKVITQFLDAIADEPNVDFITALFQAASQRSITPSQENFQQAIKLYCLALEDSPRSDGTLMSFVDRFLPLNETISNQTNILLLDGCMKLDEIDGGKRLLRRISQTDDLLRKADPAFLQYYELLLVCSMMFLEDITLGDRFASILKSMDKEVYTSSTWNSLCQWSVYSSVDLNALKEFTTKMMEEYDVIPDEDTLNAVVQTALTSKRNRQVVEKIVNYFSTIGIEGNVQTFSLLISQDLKIHDADNALQLFENSMKQGCQWDYNQGQYLSCLYQLIVQLCNTPPVDVKRVFDVYLKVRTFTAAIGYEALVELTRLILAHDYVADCGRYLDHELGKEARMLPWSQQPELYNVLYDCVMSSNDAQKAWVVYGYLQKFFDPPFESYYLIMQHFCRLKRPDAALMMFRSLRDQSRKFGSRPPDEAIYILLFNEFGRMMYEDGVVELHTYFKMDLSIEADINVVNSILEAYTNVEDLPKALETWSLISSYPDEQGANNDTFSTMIKIATRSSIEEVELVWHDLHSKGLAPNMANYRQYIIANCYHGFYLRALEIAKNMDDGGIRPSEEVIEALYNWTLLESRKQLVREWALEYFPTEWNNLVDKGSLKTYVLPTENPDNDSEQNLRRETIHKIEQDDKKKELEGMYISGQ